MLLPISVFVFVRGLPKHTAQLGVHSCTSFHQLPGKLWLVGTIDRGCVIFREPVDIMSPYKHCLHFYHHLICALPITVDS